jgi:hypothetical protein
VSQYTEVEVKDIKIGDYLYAYRPPSKIHKNKQFRLIKVITIWQRGNGNIEVVGRTATPTGRLLYANTFFWTFQKAPEIAGQYFEEKAERVRRRY